MKKIKNHIKPNIQSIEEFLSGITTFSEQYPHLQVFLHRKRDNKCFQDYEYLMITPSSFGKVIVQDLYFEYPFVIVEFLNCALQTTGIVRINVNDVNLKVLFICWQDVRKMVMEDMTTNFSNDELLELEDN